MRGIPTGHTKRQKEMIRKRAKSGMRKAQETGDLCNTFVAYLIWNPIYRELQGVGHLPEGMEIPDVNAFLQEACRHGGARPEHRRRPKSRRKGPRLAGKAREEIVVDASESDESLLGGAALEELASRPPKPDAASLTRASSAQIKGAETAGSGCPDATAEHDLWLDVMDRTPSTALPADAALARGADDGAGGLDVGMAKLSAAEQGRDAGNAEQAFRYAGELPLREPAHRASRKELMRQTMWNLMVEFRKTLGT